MNRMLFFVIVLIKLSGNVGGFLLFYLLIEIVMLFFEIEIFVKFCVFIIGVMVLLLIVILLKVVEKVVLIELC